MVGYPEIALVSCELIIIEFFLQKNRKEVIMAGHREHMDDQLRYEAYLQRQYAQDESRCRRCGSCCGSVDGDPCVHLARDETTGSYACRVYENRLGIQKTIHGKIFRCIAIEELAHNGLLPPNCGYAAEET